MNEATATPEAPATPAEPAANPAPEDNQTSKSSGPPEGLLASAGIEKPLDELPVEEQAPPVGEGALTERPANVPEQFWDSEKGEVKAEVLSNSYNDLRKQFNKMAQETGKAPEDFNTYLEDFKPPHRARAKGDETEGKEFTRYSKTNSDNPVFQVVAKAAKSANMSKGQFDDFIQDVMEGMHEHLPEPFSAEKEMEMLGEGAETLINTNSTWATNLMKNGTLNENEFNHLMGVGKTALGVQLLNKLRLETGEKPIPVNLNGGVKTGQKTPDECQAMIADPRYHEDGPVGDAYRAEVDKQFAKTFGTDKT